METFHANLLLETECVLGEGPVYDEEKDGLYWVDIQKNRIYFLDFFSGRHLYMQLDRAIGSIVLTDQGRILAGLDDGVYLFDGLAYEPYCLMPEAASRNLRFNDGKCDSEGRFIVGTQSAPGSQENSYLFSISCEGNYRVLSTDLCCSNGLAWSLDSKEMYHVDTHADRPSIIYSFDYDLKSGLASNRREIIDYISLANKGVLADGMTIDSKGNLWIAEWGGYGVGCWNPRTGEKIAHVSVPVEKVSCCTFGGKDYSTLYITTAFGKGKHAGSIFAAKTGMMGLPTMKFKE